MRLVVVGAGAVGGVLAARMAQAGHDVTAVARGAHAAVMQQDGLRVDDPDGSAVVRLRVVTDPGEVAWGDHDVVVLAVKSQDSLAALTRLAAVAPPTVLLVCAQNGVANEALALRWFPHVAGMCVVCPATHLAPGVVVAHSAPTAGVLDVGDYPFGAGNRVGELARALSGATFLSEARPDVMRWKYGKLLMNLGNAVEAVCGPQRYQGELVRRVREEGEACLRAAGIVFAADDEDDRRGALRMRPVAGARREGGSSWQSLQRGAGSIEADYLNGEVVLLGRLHGVPTPANALLQRLANELARSGSPPGTLSEDEVLAQLT